MLKTQPLFVTFLLLLPQVAGAVDAPYPTAEPQKTGWPLSDEERAYVLMPEYERRPGREVNQHKPTLWPVVPSAGFWGGTSWLDTHANLVKVAQANQGPIDVLLVGDSITMQWGAAWPKHFPNLKTVNIGIGGDKTQNVLWRLDHGGVDGLQPRVCVLLIGNNNMFFTPETGIEPVAKGIRSCVDNLRGKFPQSPVIVVKVFPAHSPGNAFYEDIKKVNVALDALNLENDPKVRLLDIWGDMVNSDGTLKKELFSPDNIHLSQDGGYRLYAEKLKPLLEAFLDRKEVPKSQPRVDKTSTSNVRVRLSTPKGQPAPNGKIVKPESKSSSAAQTPIPVSNGKRLIYPYPPYNEGKMDPQLTGWPLTDAESEWVNRGEYFRKPGHESQKHLPEMWFVTPTAARWGLEGQENGWLAYHARLVERIRMTNEPLDIVLLGDSITQGWGGGAEGAPFNAAWRRHFDRYETMNLGIGGERTENLLWRLDHGALDGVAPRAIVLMIGVNNAPLVFANGAPASSAAQAIKLCVDNLRLRCPESQIVVVKILPAFDPKREVGAKIGEINTALDAHRLDTVANVHVLDLRQDFTNADGTLNTSLYSDGHLHLGPQGYETLASQLKPLLTKLLEGATDNTNERKSN